MLVAGSKVWCLSLLALLLAHAVVMLLPSKILLWDSVPLRLYVLEGFTFVAGLFGLVGYTGRVWRYLRRSGGSVISDAADAAFFALLFLGFVSGLLIAALYRWGSSWAVVTLVPYVLSIFRGKPAVEFVTGMPFLVRLHIFSGFAGLAVLPFTRMGSLVTLPLSHRLDQVVKALTIRVERCHFALDAWLHTHNPGAWIFQDEEEGQ
jgi:nitrate reductase gamma subunit